MSTQATEATTRSPEEFIERVEYVLGLATEAAERLDAAEAATEALLEEIDGPGGRPEFSRWNHAIKVELDGLLGAFPGRGSDFSEPFYPAQRARDLIALVRAGENSAALSN